MTSAAEMAAVAKQAEDYIWSSIKVAYDRVSLFLFVPDITILADQSCRLYHRIEPKYSCLTLA